MARLTVVQVITHLPMGGAQRVALTLCERLDRDRFDPHLVAGPRGGWLERAKAIADCSFHPAEHLRREFSPRDDALVVPELARIFRRIRRGAEKGPVIVHSHAPKAGVVGRLAARVTGFLPVHTLHGLPFNPRQSRLKRYLYHALESLGYLAGGDLVSVTETNLSFALKRRWVSPARAHIIHPSVDFDRLGPKSGPRRILARHGVGEHHQVVGFVASLKPPKDPLGFVEAAATLAERRETLRFVIAGDGELRPAVEAALARRNLASRTVLLGWFDPIEALYPELDVLALPTFSEGLPLSVIEAAACGVPVAVSRVGGVAELIAHGESGLLVPPGDSRAMAQAIDRILTGPELAGRLVAEAKRGLERFRPETMVRAHERLYRDIAGRREAVSGKIGFGQ